MSLPEGYSEDIVRVSSVVSFKFPFKGTDGEKRYHSWLEGHGISVEDYMLEACNTGTEVHEFMEQLVYERSGDISNPIMGECHQEEKKFGESYLHSLETYYDRDDEKWETEVYVRDKEDRYQGSIDFVRINEETKEVWLYDWKTWGIAKKRWELTNTVKKDYGKLEKVALQLSLYADTYRQKGYTVKGIYVVHLHEEGAFEYSLLKEDNERVKKHDVKLWSAEEISELLEVYKLKDQIEENGFILVNNIGNMIFEIRKPTEQYGYINVTIDMYKEEEGATIEDKIDGAASAAMYFLNRGKTPKAEEETKPKTKGLK